MGRWSDGEGPSLSPEVQEPGVPMSNGQWRRMFLANIYLIVSVSLENPE